MKKVVGFYYSAGFDESSFETGCGGTETWIIQLSKELVSRDYHVIVFCNSNWYFQPSGVEYVPIGLFESRCEYQHFDYFIMVRAFSRHIYETITSTGCQKIYLQSHDMFVWNKDIYEEKFLFNKFYDFNLQYQRFDKFVALTDFHKEELIRWNDIPADMIEVIGNGLDSEIFDSIDSIEIEKDNSILFPTVFGRGGEILVKDIAPLVRKEIPDFRVRLCGYGNDYPEYVKNDSYVDILGTLSKKEYYKEFYKHKVWFLPCTVVEDFGICAGEAAMCECEIVSPMIHGMKDVLWPFRNIRMHNEFKVVETGDYHYSTYQLDMNEYEYAQACNEAAEKIVRAIKEYHNAVNIKYRGAMKEFVERTYTWKNIADKWEQLFNS